MLRCVRSTDPEIVLYQAMIDSVRAFYSRVGIADNGIDDFLVDCLDDTPLWRCSSCRDIDFNFATGEAPLCRYCYKDKCLDEIELYGPEKAPSNEEGKD